MVATYTYMRNEIFVAVLLSSPMSVATYTYMRNEIRPNADEQLS
nr:MAG TPA: hypothetical protein [Caudoviricetes sp.]